MIAGCVEGDRVAQRGTRVPSQREGLVLRRRVYAISGETRLHGPRDRNNYACGRRRDGVKFDSRGRERTRGGQSVWEEAQNVGQVAARARSCAKREQSDNRQLIFVIGCRMATPRQKIQGMKHENRMLKRSLIASSVCSTPAPSEDTVMTLCNRSVPSSCSDTKPETRDTSCQCEQPEDEKRADIVILSEKKTLIDAATSPAASATGLTGALDGMSSPAIDTPLRTNPRAQNLTSLIDFCSPREVRRTVLAPARCSEASWLDTERTPTILPSNVQDAEVQVAMLSEGIESNFQVTFFSYFLL